MASPIPTPAEINAMTPMQYRVYENRLRRMAQRQGLTLEKSRRRDPRALDYGTYQLTDPQTNTVVSGSPLHGYGLGLDDVERALTEDRPSSARSPRTGRCRRPAVGR